MLFSHVMDSPELNLALYVLQQADSPGTVGLYCWAFSQCGSSETGCFCVMNAKWCHAISCKRACETIWWLILMTVSQGTGDICMFLLISWFKNCMLSYIHLMSASCLNKENKVIQCMCCNVEVWWLHQIRKWPAFVKEDGKKVLFLSVLQYEMFSTHINTVSYF